MQRLEKRASARKAVIVQGQRLMLPFLADVLAGAGVANVVAYRCASSQTLRRAKPDVVVLDADAGGAEPFELIRRARSQTPARIVVITRTEDRAWNAVARAVGADAVLGPRADREELFTAVAAT